MSKMPYVKVFADMDETIGMLSETEAGRLFRALMAYINGRDVQLQGNEKFVFSMLKCQIDRDAASYQAYTEKQRENGKKGGRPRNPTVSQENPNNPSLISETQKSQEEEKEEDKDKEKDKEEDRNNTPPSHPPRGKGGTGSQSVKDMIDELAAGPEMKTALNDFVAMRKQIKKPLTTRALWLLLLELEKMAKDEPTKVRIINQSIMNSWQGFYPLDRGRNQGQRVGPNGIRIADGPSDLDDIF